MNLRLRLRVCWSGAYRWHSQLRAATEHRHGVVFLSHCVIKEANDYQIVFIFVFLYFNNISNYIIHSKYDNMI